MRVALPKVVLMDSHDGPLIAAALEHQVRSGAPATQIAGAVAATWRHAEQCLTPVLGPQGVAALYKRSLLLTGRAYPWLAGLHDSVSSSVDLSPLTSALAARQSAEAAQAGGELLQTFYGLVVGLIGPSLTHRLLRFMWESF
jgi:hypothetical protein